MARVLGFSFPAWFTQTHEVSSEMGAWSLATDERRPVRQAYERAVSTFAETSAVLYRRAAEGAAATPEELRAYMDAQHRLEVVRNTHNRSWWQA